MLKNSQGSVAVLGEREAPLLRQSKQKLVSQIFRACEERACL